MEKVELTQTDLKDIVGGLEISINMISGQITQSRSNEERNALRPRFNQLVELNNKILNHIKPEEDGKSS